MLKRSPDAPMQQSPDVRGVTIDFGDAPAHGRWRATRIVISYDNGGRNSWRRCWYGGFGGHMTESLYRMPVNGEKVVHIKLLRWELTE